MSFRMHRYDDDLDGLAAFCDVCGEQITERGFVVWNPDDPSDWLVVHQARCDPGNPDSPYRERYRYSMPLDVEIAYLANSAGVDFEKALKDASLFSSMIG